MSKRHVILPKARIFVDEDDETLCSFGNFNTVCHNRWSDECRLFGRTLNFRQTGVSSGEDREPVGRYERCFECMDSEVKE